MNIRGEVCEPKTRCKALKIPALANSERCWWIYRLTISNILLENKRICNKFSELKATVQKQQSEITAVKDASAQTRKQYAETEKELTAARK